MTFYFLSETFVSFRTKQHTSVSSILVLDVLLLPNEAKKEELIWIFDVPVFVFGDLISLYHIEKFCQLTQEV